MNKEEIINKIVEKINNLETNTKFAIRSFLLDYDNLSLQDKFDINNKVLEECKKRNITLINVYPDDYDIGLSFDIPKIKK